MTEPLPRKYSKRTRLFLEFLRNRKIFTELTWREFMTSDFFWRIRAEA